MVLSQNKIDIAIASSINAMTKFIMQKYKLTAVE